MVDVAGGGHVGFALEATNGTYQAPTKWAPIESESLTETRTDPWRNLILGRAVTSGKARGRESAVGTIKMELTPEMAIYFALTSRWSTSAQKTGVGPFVYTFNDVADVHVKANNRSLTIVVDRAGVGFAYVGCQVGSSRFFMEEGIPKVEYNIIGREQTEDYTPGAITDPTESPFGASDSTVAIAAGGRVDIDSIEFSFDDAGEAKFNIDGNEGASYIKFGEFVGEASYEVDFEDKADYAIWVARTTQEIIWTMNAGANQIAAIEMTGGIYDQFEVALGSIGDQVKASATLRAIHNVTDGYAAQLSFTSNEDVTL